MGKLTKAMWVACAILFINTVADFYLWLIPSPSVVAWGMTSLNMVALLITLAVVRNKL
jgi:hypothetical protein